MSSQQDIATDDSIAGALNRRRVAAAALFKRIVDNHPTLVAVGNMLGSSLAARAMTVVKGLVVAKLVAPEIYGVSGAVFIILAYAQYADLGTSNAASRDITAALGRGDDDEARRSSAWLGGLKLTGIIIVALGALAFSRWPGLDPSLQLGLTILPAIALPSAMQTVVLLQWQAHARIKDFSKATRITAMLDLALSVSLTWVWGLPGLLAAAALVPMFTLSWMVLQGGVVWPSLPPYPVLRRYAIVGAPFIAVALIEHNLIYVDQLIVLRYFTLHDLGIYNIALVATETVRIAGIVTGVVVGPRLIRELASVGGDIQRIKDRTLRPVIMHACFVPFLVVGIWFAAGYIITHFYPRYAESIRPMQVLLLAFYFLVVNGGVTTFLFAINKHSRNLFIIIPGLILNILIDIILIKSGWGLMSVAIGSLITYVLYLIVHLSYVISHFKLSIRDWLLFSANLFFPAANLILALMIVERGIDYSSSLPGALLACTFAIFLLSPLALRGVILIRRGKLFS